MRGWIHRRLRATLEDEQGFGLIELTMSMIILAIGIAALLAVFGAGAFSLARSGHIGTASAILDQDVEYYHRAPWTSVHLVTTAVTPNPAAGGQNKGTTLAASDNDYANQCGTAGCPGEDIATHSTVVVQNGDGNGTVSTCGPTTGTPGDPTYDSEVPPTWCAGIYDVTGPDSNLYRVYTYMTYGCLTTVAAGSTCVAAQTDYKTKIITLIIRLLAPDGTLKVPDVSGKPQSRGILAQQTFVVNYNSYIGS
jgi:hypothetical protein